MGLTHPIPGSIAPETTGHMRGLAIQILHQWILFGWTQIGLSLIPNTFPQTTE
jgi:hypothetical protein